MYIYKAGVVGAGAMGAGIAQVITYSGIPVLLKDVSEEAVSRGIAAIRKVYQGRVDKGKMTATEMEQKMLLVTPAKHDSDFSDVDIVIEAIVEDLVEKQRLFASLEKICPPPTIFATNTSSLSISAIGAATGRPERVIGMHFFNPAPVMKLVEVIPGPATSSETIDDVVMFTEGLRKIPIRVQECAGFLVNRLLMPYLNEAAIAFAEGAGAPKEIDEEVVRFGMPMGPFMLTDMIGLDVAAKVGEILHDAYGARMTPAPILKEMVAAGRTGQKGGAGFYDYEGAGRPPLEELLSRVRSARKTKFSVHRLMMPLVNEAVIALQEGVASANDIDIAMMAGTGFPQDKGGPLHWADTVGIDAVVSELNRMTEELGDRFWPAPMLKRMLGAGWLGKKSGRGFFTY